MTDSIEYLPLTALRESPFNPRKAYGEQALQELADSIRTQGILQPIVARVLPMAQGDMFHHYEIIFGHRRFRAAKLAELDRVPVIVREATDEEAAVAQVHENLQREDVSALEEADSFAHLAKAHKMSADQIATAVGKSRSYVYGRMKMARMAPEVRKACEEEGLGAEIAVEVARLPHHNLQREALKRIGHIDYNGGKPTRSGWISTREAKRCLRTMFEHDTAEAPFDIADSLMVPRAGACTTCPRRAGNDPDLQGVLEPGICTDSSCFEVKVNAHTLRRIDDLRATGHTVLEGTEAQMMMPHSWSAPKGYQALTDDLREALKEAGKKAPKITYVRNPHDPEQLVECVTPEEADELLFKEGAHTPSTAARGAHEAQGDGPSWHERRDAEQAAYLASLTPEERVVHDVDVWHERVVPEICRRVVARTERTRADLLLIANALAADHYEFADALIDGMGWRDRYTAWRDGNESPYAEDYEWVLAQLATCTPDELACYCVLMAVTTGPVHTGAEALAEKLAIAREYGVNVLEQKDDAGGAGGGAQVDAFEGAEA